MLLSWEPICIETGVCGTLPVKCVKLCFMGTLLVYIYSFTIVIKQEHQSRITLG